MIRPGSWTEAKAQDGSPGNLGGPAHVHVRASRQLGRRLNNDPGPEGTLRPSGSASASCETRTEEVSVDPGSAINKRPGMRALVRFADDAVMAFEDFLDGKRVLGVLGKRLARYGLTLHPDKTRFVDFRSNRPNGISRPETDGTSFTFLGFTHVWGRSRAGKMWCDK